MKKQILYICDRKKCKNCGKECYLTNDIKHAINFVNDNGTYIEQEVDYNMFIKDIVSKVMEEIKTNGRD